MKPLAVVLGLGLAAFAWSKGETPVKDSMHANLAIKDGQLVISAGTLSWTRNPLQVGGKYLQHDKDGVIRWVDVPDERCKWNVKVMRREEGRHDGGDGKNVYLQCAATPADPAFGGWGMTFRNGTLCLQPNTESRPIFFSQHAVFEKSRSGK